MTDILDEAERRLNDYRSGKTEGLPGEEVIQKAREEVYTGEIKVLPKTRIVRG